MSTYSIPRVAHTEDFPAEVQDALKRAWARALRHPNQAISDHGDARVVALPGGIVASVVVDEVEQGRFARVSVRRDELVHDEAVPSVARVYLAGRFEPFPVECVPGADGQTLHYAIDLEAYKAAKSQDHIALAAKTMGTATSTDAEIAAMQVACPLWELARVWDPDKVRRYDERTIVFLSDRFLVPRGWIEFQIGHFLGELAEGVIDENGMPTTPPAG